MTVRRPSPWSDKTITLFRMLCAEEALSFSDIAAAMSQELGVRITKNACIGKARRLGLPMRKTPQRERKRVKPAEPAILDTPRLAVWSVSEPPVRRANGHLTLFELERTSCRYPFGDRVPYLFCGKPIREATSYCPFHCGVVYGRLGKELRR
jgi:hypothetical protein